MTNIKNVAVPRSDFGFRHSFVLRHSSFVRQICHDSCHSENVNQRDFKKEQPAEPHQLIPAETRQRPPHPHEEEDHECDLAEEDDDIKEPKDPAMGAIWDARKMPA